MDDAELLDPTPVKNAKAKAAAPKMVDVQIDLGLSADRMTINGVEYHHGHTYKFREDMLPTINEIMHNTRMHERVVKGERSPVGPKFQGNGHRSY